MRRIFVTAALSATLVVATACTGTTADTKAGSSPVATPTTSAPVKTDDKATSCAAFKKAEEAFRTAFVAAMPALLASDTDPAKSAEAAKAVVTAFETWQKEISTMAGTGGPELKKLLDELNTAAITNLAAMKAAGADVDKVSGVFDDEKLTKIGEQIEALCK